jgi:hypothetical protein
MKSNSVERESIIREGEKEISPNKAKAIFGKNVFEIK